MSYFYIWLPIIIIIIVLITASAVSKMRFDRKRAAPRVVTHSDVMGTRIHGANNTVIYTIPSRGDHDTWVLGDTRPSPIRLNEPHDDAPPSYDQALSRPQTVPVPETSSREILK